MDSAKGGVGMQRLPAPPLPLTQGDQCRIRDRSTIYARQLFAERGQGYADQQACCPRAPVCCMPSPREQLFTAGLVHMRKVHLPNSSMQPDWLALAQEHA